MFSASAPDQTSNKSFIQPQVSVASAAGSDKDDTAEVVFATVLNKLPLMSRNSDTCRFFKQQAHCVQTQVYGRTEELIHVVEDNLG